MCVYVNYRCNAQCPHCCFVVCQVAFEASPITTLLEIEVGRQLCEMLGYNAPLEPGPEEIVAWGHITCDGTIANMESMW